MIYIHSQDLKDVNHLLILDHTTPIAVLKLPFRFDQCEDFEDWYYLAETYLNDWILENNIDGAKFNAKTIKVYND